MDNIDEVKEKGLIHKYNITKTDGTPVNPKAKYFILRLDKHQSDPIHRKACLKAIIYYATEIAEHLPALSKDLKRKYLGELVDSAAD